MEKYNIYDENGKYQGYMVTDNFKWLPKDWLPKRVYSYSFNKMRRVYSNGETEELSIEKDPTNTVEAENMKEALKTFVKEVAQTNEKIFGVYLDTDDFEVVPEKSVYLVYHSADFSCTCYYHDKRSGKLVEKYTEFYEDL